MNEGGLVSALQGSLEPSVASCFQAAKLVVTRRFSRKIDVQLSTFVEGCWSHWNIRLSSWWRTESGEYFGGHLVKLMSHERLYLDYTARFQDLGEICWPSLRKEG